MGLLALCFNSALFLRFLVVQKSLMCLELLLFKLLFLSFLVQAFVKLILIYFVLLFQCFYFKRVFLFNWWDTVINNLLSTVQILLDWVIFSFVFFFFFDCVTVFKLLSNSVDTLCVHIKFFLNLILLDVFNTLSSSYGLLNLENVFFCFLL